MEQKCVTATCIVISNGKALFVMHKKLNKWMPPGGHVEPNETPIEAVQREAMEETGFKAKIIDTYGPEKVVGNDEVVEEMIRPLAIMLETVNYKTGVHKHFDLIYLATVDHPEGATNEEGNEIGWFSKDEVKDLSTFDNVKKITLKGFEAYERYSK
ncbi:MAG: NUDIX domain-containing protein [Candidatus Micrarchaeota archaeon]|nr:NUDIX domain-containing protein [Candidatus Micrarchaeota archaeon]MDE1824384.1 NUDIX domain-containing protein [Candidatus Micrarchaeota archaeon]MDE1849682.1 NUDIX domain-containing protein [Candidatus Micrarchaeota archaeon]